MIKKSKNVFIISIFSLLSGFISCQVENSVITVEKPSETLASLDYLISEADCVCHYQQNVIKDSNGKLVLGTGPADFTLAEKETVNYSINTKIKEICKTYPGYDYSYFVQTGKKVKIFYQRKNVTYNFYLNKMDSAPDLVVKGIYGLACKFPEIKNSNGKFVKNWITSEGKKIETVFFKEDTTFYGEGSLIGTKARPSDLGDIVFADGSAFSQSDLQLLSENEFEEVKNKAIAVIVTTSYNKYSGKLDGTTMLGAGIKLDWAVDNEIAFTTINLNDYYSGNNFYSGQKVLSYYFTTYPDVFNNDSQFYQSFPAYDFVMNKYAAYCEEELKKGWYIPCYAEYDLILNKSTTSNSGYLNALSLLNKSGQDFISQGSNYFWTCEIIIDLGVKKVKYYDNRHRFGNDYEGKMGVIPIREF